jgi:hypothetical protein
VRRNIRFRVSSNTTTAVAQRLLCLSDRRLVELGDADCLEDSLPEVRYIERPGLPLAEGLEDLYCLDNTDAAVVGVGGGVRRQDLPALPEWLIAVRVTDDQRLVVEAVFELGTGSQQSAEPFQSALPSNWTPPTSNQAAL